MKYFRSICISLFLVVLIALKPVKAQVDSNEFQTVICDCSAGAGVVYDPGEKTFAPVIHLHLSKSINEWLGAALGYEVLMGEELQHCIGLTAALSPLSWLSIDLGPALDLPNQISPVFTLAFHSELSLVFRYKNMQFGPLLDLGLGKNELHLGTGMHLGLSLVKKEKAR